MHRTILIHSHVHYVEDEVQTVCGSKVSSGMNTDDPVDCRRCLGTMCGDAIYYDDYSCRKEVLRSLGVSVKEDGYHYCI